MMKKKLLVFALVIFSSFYVSTKITAQIKSSDKVYEPDLHTVESFDGLIALAHEKGSMRVIIGLRLIFKPVGELSKSGQRDQQLNIKQAQRDLLSQVEIFHVTQIKQFDYIPFLAARVNVAALKYMRDNWRVSSIEEDKLASSSLMESVPLTGAPAAWSAGFSGNGQAIAILDTGVDKNHPFLAGKVLYEGCYSSNDPSNNISSLCPNGVTQSNDPNSGLNCTTTISQCAHGTHVAGIAAGRGGNFNGVAKDADIIAIQVFSRFNNQSDCDRVPSPCVKTFTSDQILGLEYVLSLSDAVHIAAANMSLGTGQFSSNCDADPRKSIIDNLRSVGVATVIASGNEGYSTALAAPACISSAISVGSTDDGSGNTTIDAISPFSNSASFLSLLAPGRLITSSVPNGGYDNLNGTSQAAPHVSGAWAVLKQKLHDASVNEILGALKNSGRPILDLRNNITIPRIQIDKALQNLSPNIYNRKFYIWVENPQITYSIKGTQAIYKIKANKTPRRQIVAFTVDGLPNDIIASFSHSSISCSLKSACETNLIINIPRNTTPGNYTLTVTGKGFLGTSSFELIVSASSLVEAVLFYDANSPNISFREPIVDGQGNLIAISSHTVGSCTPGTCGIRLNSISPNSSLNWQIPNKGFIAPASPRYWSPVLGPNNSIYLPTLDSILHSFNSNGTSANGFPVAIAPAGTVNWQFPTTSPVLVDSNTGLIYASAAQTFSFDNFPNRIVALNPNGSEQWRVDYPNHARNSAAGNLIQGPQQDIYTFLFTNTTARFTRLNKANGNIECDLPTFTGSDRVGGDGQGVFTDYRTELYLFGADCVSSRIFNQSDRFIEFRKYNQGTIYAIDYPATGSDPIRLLAISSSGEMRWRNPDIIPHSSVQPVRAMKNGIVYVLALDGSDYNKPKLFAVDAPTGLILSRLDTSSICGLNCGVAVSDDGRVYLSNADKIYKVTGK
jgi:subtilisin family serine protease